MNVDSFIYLEKLMAATYTSFRPWTARKVPFVFQPENHPCRTAIFKAMELIEAHTRLSFCQRGNEERYILFTNEPGTNYSQPDPDNILVQRTNINVGYKALHELGHALGLIHEQKRLDRDGFIEMQWGDIQPDTGWDGKTVEKKNSQFTKSEDAVPLTSYDPFSVMHYPAPAKGWGGLETREVWTMRLKTSPSKPLGGGVDGWDNFTPSDAEGLNRLFDDIPGWSRQREVSGVGTTGSPALAVFQDRLYMVWKGSGDQHLWWSSFDGSSWSGQQQVPGVGTTGSAALAVFQGRLYLAWKGSGDQHLWWSSFDGSSWSGQQQVPGVGTTDSPALAVFQDRLYMFWKGSGDQQLWWSFFNGVSWSAQRRRQFSSTRGRPALAVLGTRLYVTWQGSADEHIWYADFNGLDERPDLAWSGHARVSRTGTTAGPALATYQGRLYMTWKGSGDQHIWSADFTLG